MTGSAVGTGALRAFVVDGGEVAGKCCALRDPCGSPPSGHGWPECSAVSVGRALAALTLVVFRARVLMVIPSKGVCMVSRTSEDGLGLEF